MLSADELSAEEDVLRGQVTALTPEQRKLYYQFEKLRIKDPDTYATLNYFLAGGLHHFYLGNYIFGGINFALTLTGIIMWNGIGLLLIALVVIIELPQLFRSQRIVHQHNNSVMRQCLSMVEASA